MLLLLAVIFVFRVLRKFSPYWAFVPALWLGYKVFKSRIRTLVNFMKLLYLDKKEWIQKWITPRNLAIAGAVLLLFVVVPWRRVALSGRFVLEPVERAGGRSPGPG